MGALWEDWEVEGGEDDAGARELCEAGGACGASEVGGVWEAWEAGGEGHTAMGLAGLSTGGEEAFLALEARVEEEDFFLLFP